MLFRSDSLLSSAFYDQDSNESPLESRLRIGRMDRVNEYLIEITGAYDDFVVDELQEYHPDVSQLKSGLKYYWQVAFDHTGGQTDWSSRDPFIVGKIETIRNQPAIPVGDSQESFQMISFTHFPEDPKGTSVLQKSIGQAYDTTNFRIGTYDPTYESGAYREYDNDSFIIEPGRAYWFLSRKIDLDISGIPVSTSTDIDIQLHFNSSPENGWNMIACPNDADYHWEDLLVLRYENDNLVTGPIPISNAQLIETTIWEWQNGEYIQNSGSEFIL